MKVKVIKPAFYNLEYLKIGAIIDYKEKALPSWAEPLKKENKKQQEPIHNEIITPEETKAPESDIGDTPDKNNKEGNENEKINPEAEMYLELLLNEAISKDIILQDTDKKSVPEQIKELEELLGIDKDKIKCV